jgi:PadR family transcriptional regulator, regulatory protein PadR
MDAFEGPDSPESPSDPESLARKFQKELNAGLVGFVLLSILDRASEDLYGYQIAKRLQGEGPDTPIAVKQGALYPVLRALAAHGLLASRIVPSYSGPARRYYRITEQGRAVLGRWKEIWNETRAFVDHIGTPTLPTGAP